MPCVRNLLLMSYSAIQIWSLLSEVGGIDQAEVVGNVLTDCQTRAGVGLGRNQVRLDADLAETKASLGAAREASTDAAGEVGKRLLGTRSRRSRSHRRQHARSEFHRW